MKFLPILSLTPAISAWFQELHMPKTYSLQNSLCKQVPNDVIPDLAHEHYKIKHIYERLDNGQIAEYAVGYPTTIYMDICRASTYEMRNWHFALSCEQGPGHFEWVNFNAEILL